MKIESSLQVWTEQTNIVTSWAPDGAKKWKVFYTRSPVKAITKGRLLHTEVQFVLIYLLRVTSSG